MSKKKHILPNGTRVEVLFEGSVVGTGTIIDHREETDDMYKNKTNLYYKVKVERNDFEKMLNMPKEHWLNSFEVKPIKCQIARKLLFFNNKRSRSGQKK